MVFNIIDWEKDSVSNPLHRKIHPTQKPIKVIEKLIKIFTDEGDVVIDPVAGSGSTLIAATNLNRKAYGFEINKEFYPQAKSWIDYNKKIQKEIAKYGGSHTLAQEKNPCQQMIFNY
jgi:site-specific DNA-methyltransferase (adenine-specific)